MSEEQEPRHVSDGRIIDDYCVTNCNGDCCKKLGFIIKPQPLMAEMLRFHYGTDIKEIKFVIHHRCPYLDEDNLCTLWDADPEKDTRPDFCKRFLCERARRKRLEVDAGSGGDVTIHLGG